MEQNDVHCSIPFCFPAYSWNLREGGTNSMLVPLFGRKGSRHSDDDAEF